MNELIPQQTTSVSIFEAPKPDHTIHASTNIEQERAIAQVQAAYVIAKKSPRDPYTAEMNIKKACQRPSFAATALFAYPRSGQTVKGPSIRLAEELARNWGNIDYGTIELSRRDGYSEMQAYCVDLETNVRSTQNFTVRHERHTRNGTTKLTDPRDIYEVTANEGARRLRARILAIIPDDLVEMALAECEKTKQSMSPERLQEAIAKLPKAFETFGVNLKAIETRLGHGIGSLNVEEYSELLDIHNSLKNGMSKPDDWFKLEAKKDSNAKNVLTAAAQAPVQEPIPQPTPPKQQPPQATSLLTPPEVL